MKITPELLSERSRRCRISPVKRNVYRCKNPYAVRGGITKVFALVLLQDEGFSITGKSVDFPVIETLRGDVHDAQRKAAEAAAHRHSKYASPS